MIRIVAQNGLPAGEAIGRGLSGLLKRALSSSQSARAIRDGLRTTVRAHFKSIYPGSKHYSPDKVTDGNTGSTSVSATGSVNVDVPGAARAYHDITIRPRIRKFLTIPIHRSSYGKSAKDFSGLFVVKNSNGNGFLAEKTAGGALAYLFALKSKVFQRRDSGLMPSDGVLAQNIFQRVSRLLDDGKAI